MMGFASAQPILRDSRSKLRVRTVIRRLGRQKNGLEREHRAARCIQIFETRFRCRSNGHEKGFDQVLKFLQQGIAAIFHFVELIWTWSVEKISRLMAVPWQEWPR
jgi:hypothetical protein